MPAGLTWLAVRRFGTATAIALVSDGIQRTARYAGAVEALARANQLGIL